MGKHPNGLIANTEPQRQKVYSVYRKEECPTRQSLLCKRSDVFLQPIMEHLVSLQRSV